MRAIANILTFSLYPFEEASGLCFKKLSSAESAVTSIYELGLSRLLTSQGLNVEAECAAQNTNGDHHGVESLTAGLS